MSAMIDFAASLPLLERVNREVNRQVVWVSDQDRLGMGEHWQVLRDFGAGDCEDFALTKRHVLIIAGLPASALLLAAGWLWNDARHVVTLVDSHDYGLQVLDSLTDDILPWNDCRMDRWQGFSVPGENIWRQLRAA